MDVHRILRRAVAAVALVLAVTATAPVALAGTAPPTARAAALPDCSGTAWMTHHEPRVNRAVWLPAAGPRVTCDMGLGSTSPGVRILQLALNSCTGTRLNADGVFGTATRNALVAAQRRAGVSPDGIYGPVTRDAISWPVRRASDGVPLGFCDVGRNYS